MIHSTRSAIEVKINGTERNPNGRTISTKCFPRHCIPSKRRSLGWIATFWCALARSNLTISVSQTWAMMPSITASTETCCTVKGGLGMPSFTLSPAEEERSKMRHHLPGWLFWGMTPKRLICRKGKGGAEKKPASLPKEISIYKYESITKGCSKEECMFDEADLRLAMEDSKPIQKPLCIPEST